MAREKMVTRTIEATSVTVLCIDTDTAEPENRTVEIGGGYKDEKSMLKAVRRLIETDTFKVVKIVATEVNKALYKMSEAKFIANAEKVEL